MQAQRRRLLRSSSPFAGLSASGPPEMDFPQFVEDTRDGTFHKDISTGSLLGLAAPFTRLSSICPGECEVGERFSPRRANRKSTVAIRWDEFCMAHSVTTINENVVCWQYAVPRRVVQRSSTLLVLESPRMSLTRDALWHNGL